jgi:hypothetical protein
MKKIPILISLIFIFNFQFFPLTNKDILGLYINFENSMEIFISPGHIGIADIKTNALILKATTLKLEKDGFYFFKNKAGIIKKIKFEKDDSGNINLFYYRLDNLNDIILFNKI